MHIKQAADRARRDRHRFNKTWTEVLSYQLMAYGLVALLWLLPIPNPVKLIAVTFHELSHAITGLLTGGRVFGIAIDPAGAGVTMGIGGNMTLILVSGYLGSCLWGIALYHISMRHKPQHAIIALDVFIFASSVLGWLTRETAVFGIGTLIVTQFLFFVGADWQRFFVMLAGSACCLYAPLEVLSDLLSFGAAPSVMGQVTGNDVAQLAARTGIPQLLIGSSILIVQACLLIVLVRKACNWGAEYAMREHEAERVRRQMIKNDLKQYHER